MEKALGLEIETLSGDRGQYDLIDGDDNLVAQRHNRDLTALQDGGWPDHDSVVEALRARMAAAD